MNLFPLFCAVFMLSLSPAALAEPEHRLIRITGYQMLNHLLAFNNPNLQSSLGNNGAHEGAYRAKLTELEHLTIHADNTELATLFAKMKDRIAELETSGRSDSNRLVSWINPILRAHTELDVSTAVAEQEDREVGNPASDIMLHLARINFYYQLRTFSGLIVPLMGDAADPISALDTEIIKSFKQADQQHPACGKAIRTSLMYYRFIRPGLLNNRSAWVHDSIDRYTSAISSKLSPLLTNASCPNT